jgi:hypothetical protein
MAKPTKRAERGNLRRAKTKKETNRESLIEATRSSSVGGWLRAGRRFDIWSARETSGPPTPIWHACLSKRSPLGRGTSCPQVAVGCRHQGLPCWTARRCGTMCAFLSHRSRNRAGWPDIYMLDYLGVVWEVGVGDCWSAGRWGTFVR